MSPWTLIAMNKREGLCEPGLSESRDCPDTCKRSAVLNVGIGYDYL